MRPRPVLASLALSAMLFATAAWAQAPVEVQFYYPEDAKRASVIRRKSA